MIGDRFMVRYTMKSIVTIVGYTCSKFSVIPMKNGTGITRAV